MGIVPLWGFQLIIAIALSIFFKLNKALVIFAANISIPPMIPIILFLSHLTGALWMGDRAVSLSFSHQISLDSLRASLTQYLLGATTLACLAGVAAGLITYLFLSTIKSRAER